MPLSLMHCHFEAEDLKLESASAHPPGRRGTGAIPTWLAFTAVFLIMFAAVTSRVGAATFGVTTPGQQTLTNRFLPYAGSGTQLIGNSPAWRDSAGVLGINNYLEGLETLTPAAAVNLNFSTWRTKRITLNQNTVFTAINIPSASTNVQTMLLEVIGDGAFTVSFANVTWQTPEITTPEAGVVTLYALRGDNGAVKGYTQAVTATGIGPLTVGYVPVANATNNVTDSPLFQISTNRIGFGSTNQFFYTYEPDFTTAVGTDAYSSTATATTAFGFNALKLGLSNAHDDSAFGAFAGANLTSGAENSLFGRDAGLGITTENGNSYFGYAAGGGLTGGYNTIVGNGSGSAAGAVTNVIVLGQGIQPLVNNAIYIGNTNTTAAYVIASGYTGTGANFLSDDGTYKAAGSSALWSSSSGNLTPSPAVDVVSIQSQSADAATNMAFRVNTSVPWTTGSLLTLANNNTNRTSFGDTGTLYSGPNARDVIPGVYGDYALVTWKDISLGDSDMAGIVVGVTSTNTFDAFSDIDILVTSSGLRIGTDSYIGAVGNTLDISGNPDGGRISFEAVNGATQANIYLQNSLSLGFANLTMLGPTNSQVQITEQQTSKSWTMKADADAALSDKLVFTKSSNDVTRLAPLIGATTTPYVLGTENTHTSGNLLEVGNNGTNKVTVDFEGSIVANSYAAGATNLVGGLAGKVTGAASSADNDLMTFSSTSGKLAKVSTSAATLGDASSATFALTFNLSGATDPYLIAGNDNLGTAVDVTIASNGEASHSPLLLNGTWFSGGSATTTKPYLLIEPTNTTSTAWSTSGTGLGINGASGFAGRLIELQTGGTSRGYIDSNGDTFFRDYYIGISRSIYMQGTLGAIRWNSSDLVLARGGAAMLEVGADAASPIDQTIKSADGVGTDKNGAHLTVEAGQSTGTGRPGDLIGKTGLVGSASGSSANAYSTRYQAVSKYVDLTGGAATAFQKFTLATNNYAGGSITATVYASDAAFAFQSLTSTLKFDAVNVGGTNAVTVTQVDNPLAQLPAGGTLTCTYDVLNEGSNVFSIRANAASSLTETILRIKWVITALNSGDAITVTPQ